MFADLDKNHYISTEFVKATGLEIQDFLDLSLMALSRFLNKNEVFLPENWFSTVTATYPSDKSQKFMETISKDIDDIRRTLRQNDDGKRLAVEHFELTPFIEFPLIKTPGRYVLTHRNILFRRLEYFVYDTMRGIDAAKFMDKFGELFERYVEKSIQHADVSYLTEDKIKKSLGDTGNQIDFLIEEDSANIYIDAKAVEMSFQGKTTHLSKILQDKTKQSILKAIKQSHDVIKKIVDDTACGIPAQNDNYLLVVTFKDLYLGNGRNYYEIIAKDKMDEIYDEYKGYPCIPPENMYFISIDELDILTDILKNKSHNLSQIIDIAKQADEKPETRKFELRMHMNSLGITPQISDYLADEKDKMFKRILIAAGGAK